MAAEPAVLRPSLGALGRYFFRLGAAGFGGPIALVGYMEREFVDRRSWVSREEFKEGLAFSQLAPGPLAAQLAMYLGWVCAGVRGATVAAVAFVGPSLVMVIALAALYLRYGGLPWLQGAFYGIGAAVIAIIARSAVKLARTTIGTAWLLWLCFVVALVVTVLTEREIVLVFLLCGALSLGLALARPGVVNEFGTIFLFFASAGLFVFGSGLAIVPFLHGGVVLQRGWLTEREFLDAVAVALITPGPVVITVAFIGFLVAGLAGALAAAAGVFAPVYLITILLAPHFQRYKTNPRVKAFIAGVTAAATGAIAGAVIVLGQRAIVDLPTALIAAGCLLVLLWTRRIPEPVLIAAAGLLGIFLSS